MHAFGLEAAGKAHIYVLFEDFFILAILVEIIKGIETREAILCHNITKKKKKKPFSVFLDGKMEPKMA